MVEKRKPKANEIFLQRRLKAPVQQVWQAWTDLKHVEKWWGPRGFTLTTHSKDLRSGGHWSYTMHGPDGVNYENRTKYHEVIEYKKLVYDHGASDDRPPLFHVTVEFIDLKNHTLMNMTMKLETPEAAQQIRQFIKQANGNSTWDRLSEHLAEESERKKQFIINRTFKVDQKTMYNLWTQPEHFSKWLAPTGFTMEFIRKNLQAGQTSFYKMSNGSNVTMYGKIHYIEMTPFDRLMYSQQFCDEKENISRHPMLPTWPETMLTLVEFNEQEDGETRVTVTWEPFAQASAEEVAVFVQQRAGMTMGWTGSFDKLENYIDEQSLSVKTD